MANKSRKAPGQTAAGNDSGVETLYKLQSTFEKNQKVIIGVIAALVILIGGFFAYKNFIVAPKEEKAANALFSAERWFEVDSLQYTLNGDGQHPGALSVIKKYSGTKAANLAYYYAGMSYLRTGDFKNAIVNLEKFDGKGTAFQYLAYGALGDAHMEANNIAKGIEYYKKAAANENDNYTSPLYLFRAGVASERNGKIEEAKNFYLQIKNNYPYSQQARDIDKYLARVGELTVD